MIGALSLRGLRQRIERLRSSLYRERARQEVLSKPISTPTDVSVKAKIFGRPVRPARGRIAPVEIDLPLSADPVQRSRQLIQALKYQSSDARSANASGRRDTARFLHPAGRHGCRRFF